MSQMAAALLKVGLVTQKQVKKSEDRKRYLAARISELSKSIRIINADISKLDESISLLKIVDPMGLKEPSSLKDKKHKLMKLVEKHIWELDKLQKEQKSAL